MSRPLRFALGRGARAAGWASFAGFEALVATLTRMLAGLRCCASSGGAGPHSGGEWAELGVFVATMLLLGAAVGIGVAVAAEATLRLVARIRTRRRSGR